MAAEKRVIVCNFNCICHKADCKFYHAIADFDERMFFKNDIYSNINVRDYNETDPEGVRRVPCKSGQLCSKATCNFKHIISAEGREILNKKWFQEKRKFKVNKLISDLENDTISKIDAAKILKEIHGIKEKKTEDDSKTDK